MPQVELSAGVLEYQDTGGADPTVVLQHGLLQDGSVWRKVVADLETDHRCVVPTLPLGSHHRAMRADADLSTAGLIRLFAEFFERLGLAGSTLVGNDWGGAALLAADRPDLIGRLVLTSCEAFDNVPPGLPGKVSEMAGRMPGGLYLATQSMRVPALRRLPLTFGWMAKRAIPGDVFDRWMRPCRSEPGVRRDLRKFLRSPDHGEMRGAADRLTSFDRQALVVWASEDRVMPPGHGKRLAELLPQGRLIEISDSYTLIPEDQPDKLARAIREFVAVPA